MDLERLAQFQRDIHAVGLGGRPVPKIPASHKTLTDVKNALLEMHEVQRYFGTRRGYIANPSADGEALVQDAVYTALRPWLRDLTFESPGEKSGNRFVIKDFRSRALRLIVEAKIVRDASHGKKLTTELHDDIEMYRNESDYDDLIFFIYDPLHLIPDLRALKTQIEVERTYDGRTFWAHVIVAP